MNHTGSGDPPPGSPRAPSSLQGIRLLLVEDEELLRIAVQGLLASAGAVVSCARDAEAAVSLIQEGEAVDVVLTDLQMPGASGLWLAEWCAGHLPGVPVVLMSAALPPTGTVFPASVRRYLRKPFDPDSLLAALAEAAGKGFPRR